VGTPAEKRICQCETMEDPRYTLLDDIIERNAQRSGSLIQVLHEAQKLFGFLPEDVQVYIARRMKVPVSKVFGVATFYALFSLKPVGRHRIQVCMGTACYVKGAGELIRKLEENLGVTAGETSKDGRFTLELVRCVGACGLSPVMMVDGEVHAKLKPDDLPAILEEYQ